MMVNITNTLSRALRGVFIHNYSNLTDPITLQNAIHLYNRFMVVHVSENRVEIPIFIKDFLYDKILDNLDLLEEGFDFCVPLRTYLEGENNASNSIMRMFTNKNCSALYKAIVGKEKRVYYGSPGVIFDELFNPIFLITESYLYTPRSENNTDVFVPIGDYIYVDNSVFIDKKGLNGFIVNKLIPWYTNNRFSYCGYKEKSRLFTPEVKVLNSLKNNLPVIKTCNFTEAEVLHENKDVSVSIHDDIIGSIGDDICSQFKDEILKSI
jgi:hypothetical protein